MGTRRLLLAAALCAGTGVAWAQDDPALLTPDPAGVVMPNITYNGWNYSPLDQLTVSNVDRLAVAWTWQIGILDSHEAPPLVVGGTMYIVSPRPNYVYALDLASDGVIAWEFRPDLDDTRIPAGPTPARALLYSDGRLFFAAADGQVFALDAGTGEIAWSTAATVPDAWEGMNGAGLVAEGLYITGNSGADRGVRGRVMAFDVATGAPAWTFYSMGPDEDVGIGPRFTPFYTDDRAGSLATWYGRSWAQGGGTPSGFYTYDPDLGLFYYSTGSCAPVNPDYRREWGTVTLDASGGLVDYRNNWCASLIARHAATGALVWTYNLAPADNWDLDDVGAAQLVDLVIGGETRQTALKASANGFFYVFDRATGEILLDPWPFRYVDFMTGVDRTTGRARYDIARWSFTSVEDRRRYTTAGELAAGAAAPQNYTGTEVSWCPGLGARNWQNDAWSPRTGLLYTSTTTGCTMHVVTEGIFAPGQPYQLRRAAGTPEIPRREATGAAVDYPGELQANDPVVGRTAWRLPWPGGNDVPVLATAGDLLFQIGADTGVVRALSAIDGTDLWSFRTGSRGNATPVTYVGPDGRQYVAFIASAAPGNAPVYVDAAPTEAARFQRSGSTLYVFAIP
ncbi:MAG: PQQ-binding-like beta-propeller repeat protein [Bauldia sp.]|nr:PQQ-binding-like beta-propeller repeat protein [Bauldia sp.]